MSSRRGATARPAFHAVPVPHRSSHHAAPPVKPSRVFLLATLAFHPASAPGQVWQPDLGDGRYKNPVIYADYSDPDVVRVGDDFYMTASSFGHVPGLPILHSKDLVNWRLVN